MFGRDRKKRGGIKPYGTSFCHPLLERRSRVKTRERSEVEKHHCHTLAWVALRMGRKQFHLFGPKQFMLLNLPKTYFRSVSGKSWW